MSDVADQIATAEEFTPKPPSDDEVFAELAELRPAAYDRRRKQAAKDLNISVTTLDKEIEALRKSSDEGAEEEGLGLHTPEPWPDEVSGGVLLDEIVDSLERHLVLQEGAAEVIALWTLHAHCYDAFYHTPRLNVHSAEKGSGKTTVLDILETLTPKGLRTENLSPATLFRVIEKYRPTLLVDEVDQFLEPSGDLVGILNAGHRQGGKTLRCEGDNNEVKAFATFAPLATAGIGGVKGTLADRAIPIQMKRATREERVEPFRAHKAVRERDLARKAARWAEDHHDTLCNASPTRPESLFNRGWDNWEPLFAIAEEAGGEWQVRLRRIADKLAAESEDDSYRVQLLVDMRKVFRDMNDPEGLHSATIVERLNDFEESPWSDWGKGKGGLTTRHLAKLLKQFDVHSRQIWHNAKNRHGYLLEHLFDPLSRYAPDLDARTLDTAENLDFSRIPNARADSGLAFENRPNPAETKGSSVLAFGNGGTPWEEEL